MNPEAHVCANQIRDLKSLIWYTMYKKVEQKAIYQPKTTNPK